MARVYLERVSRQFQTAVAVEDITFEVPDGQFWVLVGPSGCGKSTVLRLIAGLETATSGNLYIGERLVNQVPARERDVAMVFQNYALYPHMTVAENLSFGLRLRGANPGTIQSRLEAAAKSLNISHLLNRKPRQLSGGQQQRVALGRAMVRQPQVFLLDEPLSNLDAQLRDETRAELKQLHQQLKVTTIYVTHDQVEAMTLADQIVVLNQGRIQQISDPQTLYRQPANQMVATFLGSPPMNILPARYEAGELWIGSASLPCADLLKATLTRQSLTQVNLGIRPEHLHLATTPEASHFTVQVQVLEPLGREVLVRGVLDQPESVILQFWAAPSNPVQVGDHLPLRMNLDQLLAFHPQTGENLHLQIAAVI